MCVCEDDDEVITLGDVVQNEVTTCEWQDRREKFSWKLQCPNLGKKKKMGEFLSVRTTKV